jgi:hypothetical protein
MIRIDITSDSRNEGKTRTAVQLLVDNPTWYLMVRSRHIKNIFQYLLTPPQICRILDPESRTEGMDIPVLITDLE